jgi:hypothetical protein
MEVRKAECRGRPVIGCKFTAGDRFKSADHRTYARLERAGRQLRKDRAAFEALLSEEFEFDPNFVDRVNRISSPSSWKFIDLVKHVRAAALSAWLELYHRDRKAARAYRFDGQIHDAMLAQAEKTARVYYVLAEETRRESLEHDVVEANKSGQVYGLLNRLDNADRAQALAIGIQLPLFPRDINDEESDLDYSRKPPSRPPNRTFKL